MKVRNKEIGGKIPLLDCNTLLLMESRPPHFAGPTLLGYYMRSTSRCTLHFCFCSGIKLEASGFNRCNVYARQIKYALSILGVICTWLFFNKRFYSGRALVTTEPWFD